MNQDGARPEELETPDRSLPSRLARRMAADGPMSVAAFMTEALLDPRAGYYATRDPLGADGDFITAPQISQMFGELIGMWAVQTWLDLGSPAPVQLIELGPGKGTMMGDVLRAAQVHPPVLSALNVTLVEASPALQMVQARSLVAAPVAIQWATRLEQAPLGPSLILANEFLDCLPIRQFLRLNGIWRERMIGLEPGSQPDADPPRFAFLASPMPASPADVARLPGRVRDTAPDGAIVEVRPLDGFLDTLTERLAAAPGRALFIDYGTHESTLGDTFQALKRHEKLSPLEEPGARDLTAWVDFEALSIAARARGLGVHGPVAQGDWLKGLGLEHRAAALAQVNPSERPTLARQVLRLTDPEEMGALFKVMVLSSPGLPAPAGFAGSP